MDVSKIIADAKKEFAERPTRYAAAINELTVAFPALHIQSGGEFDTRIYDKGDSGSGIFLQSSAFIAGRANMWVYPRDGKIEFTMNKQITEFDNAEDAIKHIARLMAEKHLFGKDVAPAPRQP